MSRTPRNDGKGQIVHFLVRILNANGFLKARSFNVTTPKSSRPFLVLALALAFASQASGQALSNQPGAPALPLQAGVHQWIDGVSISTAKGLPFSAKVEIDGKQVLADGTMISHKTINIIGRDSSGRTRSEGRELVMGTDTREPKISFISIYDPVARTRTVLYPDQHVARVSGLEQAARSTTPATQNSEHPTSRSDDLGNRTIEGVEARGIRTTTTYPIGAVGNDRAFDVVHETWYSQDLQMTLLVVRNDPRYGIQTVRLTDLNRSPDPLLFEVPADYKVINESKP